MTEKDKIRRQYRKKVIILGIVFVVFFLTTPLWTKANYDIGLLFVAVLAELVLVGIYFMNVKHFVLKEQLKPLFNMGIKSKDLDYAQIFFHYGRYRMALMKLKFVALDHPDVQEIKTIISKIEQHMKK